MSDHTVLGANRQTFNMPEAQQVFHNFNRRKARMGTQIIDQSFDLYSRWAITD
jgi:hypothetical protein